MANPVSTIDDVAIHEIFENPYPIFDRIRKTGSAVWLSCVQMNLVTRFDDVKAIERNSEIYSSVNPRSLMNQVLGRSLMRLDGEEHKIERVAIDPSFRPGLANETWRPMYEAVTDSLIDDFQDTGETDLFNSFATPLASMTIITRLGFENVPWQDMAWWSQALIDGVGNHHGDPETTARSKAAADGIDAAIAAVMDKHRAEENATILSSMAHSKVTQSDAQISASIKALVGGGINEPRDAMLTMILGLLQNPDQLKQIQGNSDLYMRAFDESVRWVSPVGLYERRVTQDTVLGDTELKEGDEIGVCVGAANRDPSKFDHADVFDINRASASHLAFGGGPHFCPGKWVSRMIVGEVAVPKLFERLPGLRLTGGKPTVETGFVFRGPVSLPVQWDV